MTALLEIETVEVPRRLVTDAMLHLRHMGTHGCEGLALWAGTPHGRLFHVTHTLIPEQQGIRSAKGVCVAIGPAELHRLNLWLYENELTLIAQLHSHPGKAYHSDTDDEFPIATAAGSLSLVIPDFARQEFSFSTAAIYRLSEHARWEQLSLHAARALINFADPI